MSNKDDDDDDDDNNKTIKMTMTSSSADTDVIVTAATATHDADGIQANTTAAKEARVALERRREEISVIATTTNALETMNDQQQRQRQEEKGEEITHSGVNATTANTISKLFANDKQRDQIDLSIAAEIPEDVLRAALGGEDGNDDDYYNKNNRRSKRQTKSRVIMIDGQPVLRSNNYSLLEGEPSVFEKELLKKDNEKNEGDGDNDDAEQNQLNKSSNQRTSYVFEVKKPRKPYTKKTPEQKKQKVLTVDEEATAVNKKDIQKDIELAISKRAKFLYQQMKHLEPFMEPKAVRALEDRAEKFVESDKILMPVENQPASITAVLREYQLEGLRWNVRMFDQGCSCILADEMGLGKTLQSISFLACIKEMRGVKGPHLIVCPLSVLSSWMDELAKWCPKLRVVRLHSSDENERQRLRKEIVINTELYDVALTTYEMACNPSFALCLTQKVYWRCLILDEGHKVKNEDTTAHQMLKRIHRQHTLLLTGTPVQNNLHELYALLSFLHPDVFTSSEPFDKAFNLNTREHKVDEKLLEKAHYLMRPFVLRRVKGEVEVSLPPKTETKIMCPLSAAQTFWYRRLLMRESSALQQLESAASAKEKKLAGVDESNSSSGDWRKLNALLMQLRKCCNHPYLFSPDIQDDGVTLEEMVEASGKLSVLDRILTKLKENGHRVVIFSQFTTMLDILSDFLALRGHKYARLDGSTNRVQRSIDIASFNRPNSPLFAFLLSTRAGGLGVNLQTADTCVMFDSDWNPQVDMQAMARVHRIGQKKPVHIYRLVTAGTVEERMTQRAEKKLFLEQMVSRGSTAAAESMEALDRNDLYGLLRFGVDAVFSKDSGDPPSDEELSALMDRSEDGDRRRAEMQGALKQDTQFSATDFVEGKAEETPISTFMMPSKIAETVGDPSLLQVKRNTSLKEIAKEFQSQILSSKRNRTSTTMEIDGFTVLKSNNYDLETGEPSVNVRESKLTQQQLQVTKRSRGQVAGRDYGHSYTCQGCWDGGNIVCCDLCPVSVHPECIGYSMEEIGRTARWSCPHHACFECGRKSAAVGGLLFRCECCTRAYCEDHLPQDSEIIGKCKRFEALGQIHPAQACFIRCDADCQKFAKEHEEMKGLDKADENGNAPGWTMSKKVAITDVWIQERDTELELPSGNGTSKALAYATFTDLVHFLLRTEGPKKNQKKGKKKKVDGNETAGGALQIEDDDQEEEPEAGEDCLIRGAVAYYAKKNESVDEIARDRSLDARDIVLWNKDEHPGISAKSQLLELTRLWMQSPPPKVSDGLSEGERTQRKLDQRKAAEAATAAASLVKKTSNFVGDDQANAVLEQYLKGGGEGINPKDPVVFGHPLKLLRQKNLDPSERDRIMAEMFRRVRPHLERNVEMAKIREGGDFDLVKMEQDKGNDRNRRLEKRETGSPESGYELLRSGLAAGIEGIARRGAPQPVIYPHEGQIDEEKLTSIRNLILRTLADHKNNNNNNNCNSSSKDDDGFVTSTKLKVLMARFGRVHDSVTLAHARAMWRHEEFGDVLGYILAICTLERDGFIEMQLHSKWPEILDLSSVRLRNEAKIPEAPKGQEASSTKAVDEVEDEDANKTTKKSLVLEKIEVKVQCGAMDGFMRPGDKRGEENVMFYKEDCKGKPTSNEEIVPAAEFERLGGRESTRKWRQSIRIHSGYTHEELEADETKRGVPIGKWLRDDGGTWRGNVVGKPVEIWSNDEEEYKFCEFVAYKLESGEHEIRYENGDRQWLFMCLNKFRFPCGVPAKLPLESIPNGRRRKRARASSNKDIHAKIPRGVGGTWAADGIDARQRGIISGEEALESGYRVYYSAAEDTIDSVAAALGINANEFYSWNAPFYDGELPRSGPLTVRTRLFEQIPPHKDEVLAGKEAFDHVKHLPIEDSKLLIAKVEVIEEAENNDQERRKPGLKTGVKRKEGEGGDDDISDMKTDGAEEEDEDDEGGKKAKQRVARKKRDFVVEAKQAAAELEAELDAQCVVRGISIPIDYKGQFASLCDGGRSVYAHINSATYKSLQDKRDLVILEQQRAFAKAKEEFALSQESYKTQMKLFVEQQAEIDVEKQEKVEAKIKKEQDKSDGITTKKQPPSNKRNEDEDKDDDEKDGKIVKRSKRTVFKKPRSPKAPVEPTPPPPIPTHEIISVEEFVAGNDPNWLETATRAGSGLILKEALRYKGLSIGNDAVGRNIEILVPARGLWRLATVKLFDSSTGEHEVMFAHPMLRKNPVHFPIEEDDEEKFVDAEENLTQRFFLPLLTVRYLPTAWEPCESIPDPPPEEGGVVVASSPIPIAVGGMRGVLLPQGRRGEELVRYSALRFDGEKCRIAEYTCPATEFERLGGKGSAKKWRQSLRLVGKYSVVTLETMGKWLRTIGAQTGEDSIGRKVEIFWPAQEQFFSAVIERFRPETGEHELQYDHDKSKEAVQLSMQTVRWGSNHEKVPIDSATAGIVAGNKGGKKNKKAKTTVEIKQTWIQCDEKTCKKWRRVSEKSINALKEDEKWICKMSPDPIYNSCSIKQEMSDAEIANEFTTL